MKKRMNCSVCLEPVCTCGGTSFMPVLSCGIIRERTKREGRRGKK